jgi:hypothetical protein
MKNNRMAAVIALLGAVSLLSVAQAAPKNAPPLACKGGTGCPASSCPASITPAQATLPLDACPFEGESQTAVDVFSWNEFIALNWPATTACAPDNTKSILDIKGNNQGPVVWQTLMSAENVFVAPGQAPADWCTGNALSPLFAGQPRPMPAVAKSPPHAVAALANAISQPSGVQAVGGVVTDQTGRWLRYERLMNQAEYEAIVNGKWYQLSVLNGLPSITLPTNSLELKSAWKILTSAEAASGRYYTTSAIVFNTPDHAPSPGANPVTLGLVGLHIIQKTKSQPGFFWSTFEQVDNDRVFFNPRSPAPINKQTAQKPYTELNPNGSPINQPVQIKRVTPIPANAALNTYYQKLLAGSVFANYRLVSTQWQTGGAQQGTPPNVANIVIETYVQKVANKVNPPNRPSTGCLACHIGATSASGKTNTDHSFLFLEAQ